MKQFFIIFCSILIIEKAFAQTALVTINNNTLYDIDFQVQGVDVMAFGQTSNFKTNIITVSASSSVTFDPCIAQISFGWASWMPLSPSSYTCSPAPSPYTTIWTDCAIWLPSATGCSPLSGGVNDPSYGLMGSVYNTPFYFSSCSFFATLTRISSPTPPLGDDVIFDVY